MLVNIILILCGCMVIPVWCISVTYETPFLDSGKYYILEGNSLTLVCHHTDMPRYLALTWGFREIVGSGAFTGVFDDSGSGIRGRLIDRATSEFRPADNQHRLTISQMDIIEDVGEYRCDVIDDTLNSDDALLEIRDVLFPPIETTLTLPSLAASGGIVTEGPNTVNCKATFSNTPRVSDLTFALYLDDVSTGGGGTKSPNSGRRSTVTYTETVDIVRTVDKVKCVMTWESGKSFAITEESETTIIVHFEASNIDMESHTTGQSPVESQLIFTCITEKANPIAEVLWYRNDQLINSDIVNEIVDDNVKYKQRRSTLTFIAVKSDNQAVIKCAVEGNIGVFENHILDIKYPHTVSVIQTSNADVIAGSDVNLTCNTSGGYPEDILSYEWKVLYHYSVDTQMMMSQETTSKILSLYNLEYTHAGIYSCIVANDAGEGVGSASLLVKYTPIDVSSSDQKISLVTLNTDVSVNCTVLSYPAVSMDMVSIFFISEKVESGITVTKLSNRDDRYIINLHIENMQRHYIGEYIVIVDNIIGETSILMELTELGPPDPPYSVSIADITAKSVTVSWVSGFAVAFPQTFQIHYIDTGGNVYTTQNIPDSGVGHIILYKVTILEPESSYELKVVSTNSYQIGQNQASSAWITINTLAIPLISESKNLTIVGKFATFAWNPIQGNYSMIAIEKCSEGLCKTIKEIVQLSQTTEILFIDAVENFQYFLVVYQSDEEVYREAFDINIQHDENTEQGQWWKIAFIAAVGLALLIILILIAAIMLISCRYKQIPKHVQKSAEASAGPTYSNIDGVEMYENVALPPPPEPLPYTNLQGVTHVTDSQGDAAVYEPISEQEESYKKDNGAEEPCQY